MLGVYLKQNLHLATTEIRFRHKIYYSCFANYVNLSIVLCANQVNCKLDVHFRLSSNNSTLNSEHCQLKASHAQLLPFTLPLIKFIPFTLSCCIVIIHYIASI